MSSPTGTAVIQQSHVARLGYPKRRTSLSPTPEIRKRARRSMLGIDMLQEDPPSHREGHPHNQCEEDPPNEPEETDSDDDDEETGLSRQYPRDENNLCEHGLQPVWTSWGGYPSDAIPEDIKEFLDNGYGGQYFSQWRQQLKLTRNSRYLPVYWFFEEPPLACRL